MAGTSNRDMMSVQEAKLRLTELGQRRGTMAQSLVRPAVRAGALLLAGALAGRRFGSRRHEGFGASMASILSRVATTAAPLLIEQFVRGALGHIASRHGDQETTMNGSDEAP